jgi:hypothetical protein
MPTRRRPVTFYSISALMFLKRLAGQVRLRKSPCPMLPRPRHTLRRDRSITHGLHHNDRAGE